MSSEEYKWSKYSDDINRIKFIVSDEIYESLVEELLSEMLKFN